MSSSLFVEKGKDISSRNFFLWTFAMVLFFSISSNPQWRADYLLWYGSLAFVFISYLFVFNWSVSIKNFSFEIWLISFIVLGFISLFWSLSVSTGMDVLKNLIVFLVVIVLIHSSVNYGFNINILLKCYFVAIVINAIYIVLTIDISQLGETQLGTHVLEGWNGNGIGFMTARGVLFGLYLFGQTKKKIEKALYILVVVLLSILTMYTGSRTAFIVLVVELVLMFWMSNPKKIIRNMIITVVVITAFLYLIMNVEDFYNVLGSRMEGLFALFTGEGKVDSSSDIRDTFINNGKQWFSENPLFGYGINNYKILNQGVTGRFTYSHNNFIELAVNLGVIGLVWYYSVYLKVIVKLLRSFKNNPLAVFLISALIASLISHYGDVTYYEFYQNFLLLLCLFAVEKKGMKNYYEGKH